jgi:hypothetical protein
MDRRLSRRRQDPDSRGRLIIQGKRGDGVATLMRDAASRRVMLVEMTLFDNSHLSARLWPSPERD